MIKRETKYIIRRILIGVGIALILGYINACEVKAENYTYYFYSTPIYYYNANTLNISRTPTTYNTTYVYGGYGNNTTNQIIWKNDVNLSFTNISFVTFNAVIKHSINDGEKPIRNVSFLDMPCNFTEHNVDQAVENSKEISAICYVSSPKTIQANSNFVTIQMEYATIEQVSISTMNIINNQDLLQSIRNKMNDLNQNLSEINLEIYRIEGVVNTIPSAINTQGTNITNSINTQGTNITDAINNQNTQQHNDSQAEINNATQNTQDTINSQKVCKVIDKNDKEIQGYMNWQGNITTTSSTYAVTKYIKINQNTEIKFKSNIQENRYYCFYDINKVQISCANENGLTLNENITIPNNASYIRFTIIETINKPQVEICENGNQALNNSINDMNDTLKDSNIDSPNNSISQMEQNLPTNSVISDLLTLPITMFQNIVNAIDGTCSSFSLGSLFGTNLVLPCINISNYLGSALWGAIDVIFCGIFVLSMRKKFVEIFENITSLKNGGNELE